MSLILLAFCGLFKITAPFHFWKPQKSAVFIPQNCPHCGQKWSARRKKAPGFSPAFSPQRSKSLDFSLFDVLGEVTLSIWCWLRACHFLQSSRTEAQRPIFRLPVGTRPAVLRKPHKPPTRARRAGIGVLSVRSTCVLNKIGIFPPCCVLVQLLHLPVIVLLECRLNRSDCE